MAGRRRQPATARPLWTLALVAGVAWALAGGTALSGPAGGTPHRDAGGAGIRVADLRRDVQLLASDRLEGRRGRGAVLAARFVRERFRSLGLKPLFHGRYFQPIRGLAEDGRTTTVVGTNVGAVLPGCDERLRGQYVLLEAHFDHLGRAGGRVYPGADDNASGVAMLLAVARWFASALSPPRRSVVFLSFDLEERGLVGARWFVRHSPVPLERVRLFVVADLLGRSLGDLPLHTVFVCGSEHSRQLREILDSVRPANGLQLARVAASTVGTRSDYGPFRDRHVPFLFFTTGEHPDYHTPNDRPERLDYDQLAAVCDLVRQVVLEAATRPDAPQWSPTEEDLAANELRLLKRVTGLLLDPKLHYPLSAVQRALVARIHRQAVRLDADLAQGRSLSAADKKWVRRSVQLLVLLVF